MSTTRTLSLLSTLLVSACTSTATLYSQTDLPPERIATVKPIHASTPADGGKREYYSAPGIVAIKPLDETARRNTTVPAKSELANTDVIRLHQGAYKFNAFCTHHRIVKIKSFSGELRGGMTYELSCVPDPDSPTRLTVLRAYPTGSK